MRIKVEVTDLLLGYKLKTTCYYKASVLQAKELEVINAEGDTIGSEMQDENGVPDFAQTSKHYWDCSHTPHYEIFECRYDKQTGDLLGIYWADDPSDRIGQTGFVLRNTPKDIQRLIDITGMSPDLISYYLSPNVMPSFAIE